MRVTQLPDQTQPALPPFFSQATARSAMADKKAGAIVKTGDKKAGAIVKTGEEGMKLALSIIEEFDIPLGLLPLADIVEVGFVRETGYMWMAQKNKIEHNFKLAGKLVSYDKEITGYIQPKRIRKLKGIKAKELLLWPPVSEVTVDDPPAGKIHFKSLAGITKTFPVEAFAAGQ